MVPHHTPIKQKITKERARIRIGIITAGTGAMINTVSSAGSGKLATNKSIGMIVRMPWLLLHELRGCRAHL
jgi:hypothetical protein